MTPANKHKELIGSKISILHVMYQILYIHVHVQESWKTELGDIHGCTTASHLYTYYHNSLVPCGFGLTIAQTSHIYI